MSSVIPVNKSTYFSQGCEADDDVEDQSYHQKAEPDTVSQETQENTQVLLSICWASTVFFVQSSVHSTQDQAEL